MGILQSKCKECHDSYSRKHYKKHRKDALKRAYKNKRIQRDRNRENMIQFLQGKTCKDCPETDIRLFQFHHRDPNEKDYDVSTMLTIFGWKRILKEIAKCDLLCAHCHIKREFAKNNHWYKNRIS